jgi:hypothetical protein
VVKKSTALSKQQKADLANREEFAQVVMAGIDGEATSDDVARVRALLANYPDEFREFGELASQALDKVVMCATTWVVEQQRAKERMQKLKDDLGYASSNIVEQMAITQVVLNWARLYFLENNLSTATKGSHNKESAHYWDRRVTMAQGRYNQALISLAKIRKLKLPDITAIQAQVAYVSAGEGAPVEMRAKHLLPSEAAK